MSASLATGLRESLSEARKRVDESLQAVRNARKGLNWLCLDAAIAFQEQDTILRDLRIATVLAECEHGPGGGVPLRALKGAFRRLFSGVTDKERLRYMY